MKELSIEEKAKEFDASLERAKKLIETCDNTAVIGWCEYIFPMLKEPKSEDEKIRKEIIEYIKIGTYHKDWVAWLEKQGEQKELSQSKVTKISDQEWSVEFDENLMMIEDRFSDYLDYIREDSSLTKHRKNTLKEEIIGYVNWLKTLKERLKQAMEE